MGASVLRALTQDPSHAYPLLAGVAHKGGLSEAEAERLLTTLQNTNEHNIGELERLVAQPAVREALTKGVRNLLQPPAAADRWQALPACCPECDRLTTAGDAVAHFRQLHDPRVRR